ncbi:GGDEF domain-containing protein [Sphingomonas abietis]|uniref:diguanylate cyclase n=1 Tax=Sphingomonas abietis TaxID=3012344 RepID=A0ABY7NNK3_9SPHN|nr:GGDEF domain-containing protein [Sphingomonas abietis]WBO21081.1 GGDEF domain-containing protein [Sphingomonas abietis]
MGDMEAYAIISGTMLFVSLILATALAIAWRSLGRPRHALSWSIAYLMYGGEVLFQIIEALKPASNAVLAPIELVFVLAPGTLVAIGARQRANLPPRHRLFVIATVAALCIGDLPYAFPGRFAWTSMVAGSFTTIMLGVAIAAILPRGRKAQPAEWATIAALAIFAMFEMMMVIADGVQQTSKTVPDHDKLFVTIYLVALTPVFVTNGMAAILLLASDLAAKLRTLAVNDPLTGVLNRRGFHEAALRAVSNGRRQHQSITACIADIDHFKSINDRFGHTAGDNTLKYICDRLTEGLRGGDLVGRVGGEEFAMLLVNSSAEQAAEAMERIRADIAAGYAEDGAPTPVTASFGVAPVAFGTTSPEQMLLDAFDQADRALYRSKVDGRNRTSIAA